jgi:hypothetical protein
MEIAEQKPRKVDLSLARGAVRTLVRDLSRTVDREVDRMVHFGKEQLPAVVDEKTAGHFKKGIKRLLGGMMIMVRTEYAKKQSSVVALSVDPNIDDLGVFHFACCSSQGGQYATRLFEFIVSKHAVDRIQQLKSMVVGHISDFAIEFAPAVFTHLEEMERLGELQDAVIPTLSGALLCKYDRERKCLVAATWIRLEDMRSDQKAEWSQRITRVVALTEGLRSPVAREGKFARRKDRVVIELQPYIEQWFAAIHIMLWDALDKAAGTPKP